MTAFIGIDPGVSGAIAVWAPERDGYLRVHDMPTFGIKRGKSEKREVDAHALATLIVGMMNSQTRVTQLALAALEMASCRPGQSVSAVHANGRNWGVAYGCLVTAKAPTQIITPQAWKKALACPADKDGARKRASQLLPQHAHLWARAKDDGRAEAALIALYAERLHNEQKGLAA